MLLMLYLIAITAEGMSWRAHPPDVEVSAGSVWC